MIHTVEWSILQYTVQCMWQAEHGKAGFIEKGDNSGKTAKNIQNR